MISDEQKSQILEKYRQRLPRGDWFIVQGRWPVEALLTTSLEIHSVLLEEDRHAHLQQMVNGRAPVLQLSSEEIEALMGFPFHRGVLACAHRPQPQSLNVTHGCVVICPQIADENNLGAIVRNAACFGATAVAVSADFGADIYSRKAIRSSSGTVFRMPVFETPDLMADVFRLKENGFQVVGTSVGKECVPIRQAHLAEKIILLLGSEESGLRDDWFALCDLLVTIPIAHGVDSLNVACSSAVLLYEISQKIGNPRHFS